MKKTIYQVLSIILIIIGLICLLLCILPRPVSKQELNIGDKVSGYRIMDRWNTTTYFTYIKKETKDNIYNYEIKFIQYYNNNQYEFVYYLNDEDYITLYYDKIPNEKIKLKVLINYDTKSIILENEELINKKQNSK